MRQLESLVGEDLFRDGLREYLHTFSYGNATWPDLIDILDRRADAGLTVSRCSTGTAVPRGKVEDFAALGYIGLKNHDRDVKTMFRNIFIKSLD